MSKLGIGEVANSGRRRFIARQATPLNLAELRGDRLFARIFKFPSRRTLFRTNGLDIPVKAYHINTSSFKEMGIDPDFLRGGAEVLVASPEDFRRYGESLRLDPGRLAGVYSPNGAGERKEIAAGRQDILSAPLRKVLVSEEICGLELVHEIIHDLFFSMKVDDIRGERAFFSRLVIQEAFKTLIYRPDSPESKFFRGIAHRCPAAFNLKTIADLQHPGEMIIDRMAEFYISEVFAYGASMIIFQVRGEEKIEEDLGKVPDELRLYFESRIVSSSLLAPAQKIA